MAGELGLIRTVWHIGPSSLPEHLVVAVANEMTPKYLGERSLEQLMPRLPLQRPGLSKEGYWLC